MQPCCTFYKWEAEIGILVRLIQTILQIVYLQSSKRNCVIQTVLAWQISFKIFAHNKAVGTQRHRISQLTFSCLFLYTGVEEHNNKRIYSTLAVHNLISGLKVSITLIWKPFRVANSADTFGKSRLQTLSPLLCGISLRDFCIRITSF